MSFWNHMGWGPGWWILGSFLWLGFWIAVVVVIVSLVRGRHHHHHEAGQPTSALRLLEERYARGEVTREEFLERRAVHRLQRLEHGRAVLARRCVPPRHRGAHDWSR